MIHDDNDDREPDREESTPTDDPDDDIEFDGDGSERVQVCGYVTRRTRELAKYNAERGGLSDAIAETIKGLAYGEAAGDRAALKRELETVRDEIDEQRGKIRERQAKVDRLERKKARLEERMTEMTDQEERYEGHLESLEGQVKDGMHLWPDHGGVKRAASTHEGKTPADVLADLRERNPEIPARAFEPAIDSDEPWDGVTDDSDN